MMHWFDTLLATVGCGLTFFGLIAGILCGHIATMAVGLLLMMMGMGLDKAREIKRERAEYRNRVRYYRW